ncbi:hypothetical protein ACFVJ5_07550 [Nocardia sp. NPDC127606]|uniref:hypothetical protein n=1 Tax=Nocardia sp. NPDC127606 TaxID=3345406 RepID=UPI0036417F6A
MSDDGFFVRAPADDDNVLDLADAPDTLEAAYVGNTIRALALRSGTPWYESAGYKAMKESLDLLTLGVEVVELAVALDNWASGGSGSTDPALQALAELNQKLTQIQDFQLAHWITSREEDLSLLRSHSMSALQTAREFLRSGASSSDPTWQGRRVLAERDSQYAVNSIIGSLDDAYWMRPYSVPALSLTADPTHWRLGWMSNMTDRARDHGFGRVWDYRWALPVLLYAISVRTTVLRAFQGPLPAGPPPWRTEAEDHIAFLQRVWERMESGVRHLTLEKYSGEQMQRLGSQAYLPMFAVDIHGGHFVGGDTLSMQEYMRAPSRWNWVEPRPTPDLVRDAQANQPGLSAFVRLVGTWGYSQVCQAIGLPDLLVYISILFEHKKDVAEGIVFPWWLYISRSITESQTSRTAAALAASLAAQETAGQPDESAIRTFDLFSALRSDDDHVRAVVAQCADEVAAVGVANRNKR